MALNLKDIEQIQDIRYKTIKVPAWKNAELVIKSMTVKEKVDWSTLVNDKKTDDLGYMIKMLMVSCVDDNHQLLFNAKHEAMLKHKSFNAIQYIFDECITLSAMSEDDVEEEAKN